MFVRSEHKLIRISFDDIVYIEGQKDYVRFCMEDGSKITSLINMKKLEQVLPRPEFLRTHRSYIVHMPKVKPIDHQNIIFDSIEIPISDSYKEYVANYFDEHTLA
jgi:DNA-binding LytR/AlgR family response regulator